MLRKCMLLLVLFSLAVIPSLVDAGVRVPPQPARIGGTVTYDGTQVLQADTGWKFTVTDTDGNDYVDVNGVPASVSSLKSNNWYVIDIPLFDATDQQQGANTGETAVIHAYKDDVEVKVTSPVNGQFQVGASGSTTQINIEAISCGQPTANAGPDQTVNEGATVTLDGSGSQDATFGLASYEWTQTGGPDVTLSDSAAIQPTFTAPSTACEGAVLTFQLEVANTCGGTSTDTVQVTVNNVPTLPTANAGPDQTVNEGATVTLNGSNSTTPEGFKSRAWTQTGGPEATLSDAAAAKPTFTAPNVDYQGVSLTFELTVTDLCDNTAKDTVIVNVTNVCQAPTANAGPNQTVNEGATVTLDATNSVVPEGGAVYGWVQKSGAAVKLSNASSPKPTFTAPQVDQAGAALTFEVTVTDNCGLKSTDKVGVNVSNVCQAPTANAGPDQTVNESEQVTLDGSGSTANEGIKSYLWTQKSGTAVTLSDATAVNPTFTAPSLADGGCAALVFELTVTDNCDLQATDEVAVNVCPWNPPTADAGVDQTVEEGDTVTLDGSASHSNYEGVALTGYQWTVKSGQSVTLADPTQVKTTFVAPNTTEDQAIQFELTVTDGHNEVATDDVTVTVTDNGITIPNAPEGSVSTESATGKNLAFMTDGQGDLVDLNPKNGDDMTNQNGKPNNLLYGIIGMNIKLNDQKTRGDGAVVTVYLDEAAPSDYVWYIYTDVDGFQDFSDNATFNEDRTQVTLALTDGGAGDADGTENGVIQTDSGLGQKASTFFIMPSSGSDDKKKGCFISTMND
ncbi:MAG: choice-of-anchor U domain-containing protein [Pseudomonadota bacterium]